MTEDFICQGMQNTFQFKTKVSFLKLTQEIGIVLSGL
jgi:hypothetical protein